MTFVVDEAAFRQRISDSIEHPCSYGKAILSGCVSCTRVARIQIAEREVPGCLRPRSQQRCNELHAQLRRAFSFALGRARGDAAMSHAQEMRIQCGGLRGLQYVLNGSAEVADVDALLAAAVAHRGTLADIPYSDVIHAATQCYQGRHH